MEPLTLAIAMVALGAGTFALRFAGPVLRAKMTLSLKAEQLMTISAVVLLAALVGIAALTEGHGFAGIARHADVLVGGVLAWRKAPFVAVVVAAAATAALLRLAGVP